MSPKAKPKQKPKRAALGRGLGALIKPRPAPPEPVAPDAPEASPSPSSPDGGDAPARHSLRTMGIEQLVPNPAQPRKRFDEEALAELAASVKLHGIIQPIVVTPTKQRARFLIVAGERRWRAAQKAGLHDVPVVVRDTPESDRLELAVIENLQRENLNPIEEALAFRQLMDVRAYTQEQLADRLGKDRSTISNALRLLGLPAKVQELVQTGKLKMGHARALLGLPKPTDMVQLAAEVVRTGMSVRAIEKEVRRRVRAAKADAEDTPQDPEQRKREIIVRELEQRLRRTLGVRVNLKSARGRKGAGTIELPYSSLDELDRLLHVLLDGNP